jgi:hypothetical protein
MSDLIDFRLNITPETDHWLEALAKGTGKCKKELARQIFHDIAIQKIHEISVANSYLYSKGLTKD